MIRGLSLKEEPDCEGGCGVIGIAGTDRLPGSLIIRPCSQMRNRGNGKGGGVAACGLFPGYADCYALHIAYLDQSCIRDVEDSFVDPNFDVPLREDQAHRGEFRDIGLEIRPPDVRRYFVRVKSDKLDSFIESTGITDRRAAEDEFVYQNSFNLNKACYAGRADPRAFVLSHGRDLMILKGVGYAEDIARYYCLEDVKAHVWIGHQRYPTRGRVWHPGGAHPFAGLHEALVHNGDFANYHASTEYLKQHGMVPLFVTDTEVSVLLFDYYSRVLGYPLEYVIEALGPTPEGDFERLSKKRQRVYRAIQTAHLHGSPDGPWFFIVARCDPKTGSPQLIGITDVSMLRPQVFSLQRGAESYGAIASEKQAIDAFFEELSSSRPGVAACADRYWNARGGSCTDGGAFVYTVEKDNGRNYLRVEDKFGNLIEDRSSASPPFVMPLPHSSPPPGKPAQPELNTDSKLHELQHLLRSGLMEEFQRAVSLLAPLPVDEKWRDLLLLLTTLRDRRWDFSPMRPSQVLSSVDSAIRRLLDSLPGMDKPLLRGDCRASFEAVWAGRIRPPSHQAAHLVVDAREFPPDGDSAVCRFLVEAYKSGWKRFIVYNTHGDRFIGCGLGPSSEGVHIDVYGSSGDYLGSGMDGANIAVHGNAQDQVGQILKSGRIIIHGDVGQTFLYGAKGGEAFVLGNAAGRPLINAVGKIRAIINGTCLDYCAESFMAGNELDGGFVIINGVAIDRRGEIIGMEMKYPGNNLFSLASGGACYLNDPYHTVNESQLNGAAFVPFSQADWNVILPYLRLNEDLFGISIRYDLLVVDGVLKWPKEVFRKVVASRETTALDWSSL